MTEHGAHGPVPRQGLGDELPDADLAGARRQPGEQGRSDAAVLPRVGDDEGHLGRPGRAGQDVEAGDGDDLAVVVERDEGLPLAGGRRS